MFFCLYYSFTIYESKEKFRTDFCYFLAIKNIVAASLFILFHETILLSNSRDFLP